MKKKLTALILCLALTLGLLIFPASAQGSFPDVTDPTARESVEVLRLLGVVNGRPDGTFDPGGSFTRAEFCKMALVILGRQGEAALQSTRVIFTDVTASHWALGYVNAAAVSSDGSPALVQGMGNGRFEPNSPITYGAAVTILMRALGFADQDVGGSGGAWYAGYMAKAQTMGLLDGISSALTGNSTLTRAQAARLFYNLLFTKAKGSGEIFLASVLGGSVTGSTMALDPDGPALPSGGKVFETVEKRYVTYRDAFPAALKGQMAALVLDREGCVLTVIPDDSYTTRAIRIFSAEARYIITSDHEQLIVPSSTPVWTSGGIQSTYGELYMRPEFAYGATALFCYDKTNTLEGIYLSGGGTAVVTAIAAGGSEPFRDVLDSAGVTVYKNGLPSSMSKVRQYDVGIYDSQTDVLNVYDRKLTGIYENAAPSLVSPDKIQVMGLWLDVLDCALLDLTEFHVGDPVTLLLDGENRVAGVVSPEKCASAALGLAHVTITQDEKGKPVFNAKVALAMGLEVSGQVATSVTAAAQMPGRLVAVSSSATGQLTLTEVQESAVPSVWDVKGGKIGSLLVTPDAAIYDRVGDGPLLRVPLSAVTVDTVKSGDIQLLHQNSAGQVDALILNNVTGDGFSYGILSYAEGSGSGFGYQNPTLTVTNGSGQSSAATGKDYSKRVGEYVGMTGSLPRADGTCMLDQLITLTPIAARRSSFADGAVTINGVTYPLAGSIDSCCYNAAAGTWFDSLEEAMVYSARLTLYYDRAPEKGGKIRLIVVG